MKRKLQKCMLVILAVLLIGGLVFPLTAVAETRQMNRYNVVFVTDASGSMTETDPEKNRFEAIDLFAAMLANGGNYVGNVVFADDIVIQRPLKEITNKGDKKAMTDDLKSQAVNGWTNIGSGLQAALRLLESDGNPDLPSIIILLTDGNTELGQDDLNKKSLEQKEDAMETARQKGIKIYTISLNKNNTANSNELKQIAKATGGEFREVTESSDLQSVFDLYYQMIYSTQSTQLVDEQVPASGVISRDFSVVELGVEEVNIVIFGDVKDCQLTKPDKSVVSPNDMQDMLYNGASFTLLKITNPVNGTWNLTVNAEPGTLIKIFKIYNANLQVAAGIDEPKDNYPKDEPIGFTAQIKENDVVVSDTARYQGYQATLAITDYEGKEVFTQTCDSAQADGYHFEFTPKDYGAYYARVSVKNEQENLQAETADIDPMNVGNTPPTAVVDVMEKHVNIWPFLIETDASIDMSGAATDKEDPVLNYRVQSSSWLEEDYTLDGATLTIDNFSVSKGSFTIEAYDSFGAYCTFDVRVTSTNIGLVAMILILAGGLLAVAIIVFLFWWYKNKKFMGQFEVENLAPPYQRAVQQKNRGQLKLRMMQIGPTGLDKDAYVQATGKNFVYFVSKKPVYNDYTGTKSKKIKIESSIDIKISPTEDYQTGIRVRFESLLNNPF
ncbi:MAG: VWA domain-containing protein [Clostridia bacterium]|nr:VWA domain-containing protein [Clostridia bacterium]